MSLLAKQPGRFTETEIDDEVVVMCLDSGDFFCLKGTAASTWRLIDGTRDREALLAALAVEFDAEESDIATDVDEFLERLREIGMLADE